ncbi:MAG TPA: ABC transporter permease [Gemmata sp.]|nr:ABC transporter permease [Gemmata sp.]
MPVFTLALKDLRLLLRDARSAVILFVTPLILILVLGLALGEGFGEKPDERLRISVVNLDKGLPRKQDFPLKPWSEVVMDDLTATAGIRLEILPDLATADRLVARNSRAAVIVFAPDFSEKMNRCSFLTHDNPPPINPFDRDGVRMNEVGLSLLKDNTQPVTANTIEQVAQVTLLRVLIPWMIGRAFERVGDDAFMAALAEKLKGAKPLPPAVLQQLDPVVQKLLTALFADKTFQAMIDKKFGILSGTIKGQVPKFQELIQEAFKNKELLERVGKDISFGEVMTPAVRDEVGPRVRDEVQAILSNYDFRAKTWAGLNKDRALQANLEGVSTYRDTEGSGFLNRGAVRYQVLVPSYTVMFAFFLVLSVGWLFVTERKHGTLVRLRAAPLTRGQILMGKLLPCLFVSLAQGFFLLIAGYVIFGMTWGTRPELLIPVVICTSFAAVGLAVLVASIARTETQVAVYGTLLVLVLGGVSGSLMPRDLMPEKMKTASLVTPHAWALDAYAQLLANPNPDLGLIATACGVLVAFGAVFTLLAWWRMDLE